MERHADAALTYERVHEHRYEGVGTLLRADARSFIAQGSVIRQRVLAPLRYALAGPARLAHLISDDSAVDAFRAIAAHGLLFHSRADDSSTNQAEIAVWRRADLDPRTEPWFHVHSIFPVQAFLLAARMGAFCVIDPCVDRGNFTSSRGSGTFHDADGAALGMRLYTEGDEVWRSHSCVMTRPDEASVELRAWLAYLDSDRAQRNVLEPLTRNIRQPTARNGLPRIGVA